METRVVWHRFVASVTRYAPRKRLALIVALSGPLWMLPAPFNLYVGASAIAFIIAITAVDFLMLPTRAAISVQSEFPATIGIGDTLPAAYVLGNSTSRVMHVELRNQLPRLLAARTEFQQLRLAPHSVQRVELHITGMARGAAGLGPIGIRVFNWAGLVSATFGLQPDDSIRVIPSVTGVRRFRLLAMQHRLDTLGVRVLRRKGGGQAFANLREYVRGDDPRHIDWKATSKKDKLITREFTVERSQTVITLIDAGRGMTQLSGTYARFEHALSSALILTDIASNSGDRVGTMVFDDEVRAFVPPQASRAALQLVRDAFVPVVATTREPDYASAFRFLAAHQGKRALIVFFTDVIDVRASQALLAYVTRSAIRHLVLVVALRNDSLFNAARIGRANSSASLFEVAAAEEVIGAREEALHRMRRAGVIVLDVSPQTMTAAVVNQYLELKGRGAL
ncbi:MAG: DUF58 domain-containing protein [Gemmatimonadota bacterium]|nr:DUF58 domain-containing protein [Gemmatimonadota bacterium]